MDKEEIIAEIECSGMTDSWVESLCMKVHPDGSVTLTSKAAEVLGYEGEFFGEVVWADGIAPEGYDPATNRYEFEDDDPPLPVSVAGKPVGSYEYRNFLGTELLQTDDEATATFQPGEGAKARAWVDELYGERMAWVPEDVLERVETTVNSPRPKA
jgi:hypothetical protein